MSSSTSRTLEASYLELSVKHCGQVTTRIELAFWALLFVLMVNTWVLLYRPQDLTILYHVELVEHCRDQLPFDPGSDCAELRSQIAEDEGVALTNRLEWEAYIERKKNTLDYKRSVLNLPVVDTPVPIHSVEFLFGALYCATLLFVLLGILELQASLNELKGKGIHEKAAAHILRRKCLVNPTILLSQLGIFILLAAVVAASLWNVAIFGAIRSKVHDLSQMQFYGAILLATATLILAAFLYIPWLRLRLPESTSD